MLFLNKIGKRFIYLWHVMADLKSGERHVEQKMQTSVQMAQPQREVTVSAKYFSQVDEMHHLPQKIILLYGFLKEPVLALLS